MIPQTFCHLDSTIELLVIHRLTLTALIIHTVHLETFQIFYQP